MFKSPRYITKGARITIELWLQNLMWYAIDVMEVEQKDYLQVFELSAEDGKQKIIHTQEQPPYEHEYLLESDEPITTKVFIIDDLSHTTMLLASEY